MPTIRSGGIALYRIDRFRGGCLRTVVAGRYAAESASRRLILWAAATDSLNPLS